MRRATIREAMLALGIAGELEIRSGSGLRARPYTRCAGAELRPDPTELLRARIVIEGAISADAALYASAGDLTRIEKTLRAMRRHAQAQTSAQVCE